MRISISVVATSMTLATDLFPLDVFPDMTLNDLKALVEDEIKVPAPAQYFFLNNQPLVDAEKTLEQLNISEGDMLGLAVQNPGDVSRTQQQPGQRALQTQQGLQEGTDPERFRLHIIADSRLMDEVRARDPEMANAASDPRRFHAVWEQRQRQRAAAQAEKEEQMALMDADPFNVEAQTKIEEIIRQERIQENMYRAFEEIPEVFGRVTMLYIDVLVNNTPIKAFVDSGAQTTIMSPDAAERCGIKRLIDTRFGGIARGVGTARILGRVYYAEIQIGQYNLASSFTVMEGKDVDLLLGLDMLKKHQMCIDLRENCLRVHDDKIPFLPESEIPKTMEEILDHEPKIAGPDGTKIGTITGTVEQEGQSSSSAGPSSRPSAPPTASSRINVHPIGSAGNIHTGPGASSQRPGNSQSRSSATAFGQGRQISAESITQITEMGFPREAAIRALEQANGNVDLAVGILSGLY